MKTLINEIYNAIPDKGPTNYSKISKKTGIFYTVVKKYIETIHTVQSWRPLIIETSGDLGVIISKKQLETGLDDRAS